MRVLSNNIKHGEVAGLGAIADVIRSCAPDVVALNEVGRGQAPALGRMLGMHAVSGVTLRWMRYGNALLFADPPEWVARWRYARTRGLERRGGLAAGLGERAVVATHLGLSVSEREAHARDLVARIAQWDSAILAGDLNEIPAGPVSEILGERLRDACPGGAHTYPAGLPDRRIDYVMVTSDISVRSCEVIDARASDHRPVLVTLD